MKTINGHIIARYRDDPTKVVEFCKVCGKEELELWQADCPGEMAVQKDRKLSTDKKKEEFVSGLPEKD